MNRIDMKEEPCVPIKNYVACLVKQGKEYFRCEPDIKSEKDTWTITFGKGIVVFTLACDIEAFDSDGVPQEQNVVAASVRVLHRANILFPNNWHPDHHKVWLERQLLQALFDRVASIRA